MRRLSIGATKRSGGSVTLFHEARASRTATTPTRRTSMYEYEHALSKSKPSTVRLGSSSEAAPVLHLLRKLQS